MSEAGGGRCLEKMMKEVLDGNVLYLILVVLAVYILVKTH